MRPKEYSMPWKSLWPRLGQAVLDLTVGVFALVLSYIVRFDGQVPSVYRDQFLGLFLFVVFVRFALRWPFGIHKNIWRFTSIREVVGLVGHSLCGSFFIWLFSVSMFSLALPWGVLVLDGGFYLAGMLALRGGRRFQAELAEIASTQEDARRVILVGAGQAGVLMAREVKHNNSLVAVGFLDDDLVKVGSRAAGLPVLGRLGDLPTVVREHHVHEVIFCIPSAPASTMRRVVADCQKARVQVRTLPGLQDLISGRVSLSSVRELRLEDLLGRDPVQLNSEAARAYLAGRVVLVTGAGGSIGSELVRQIARLGPARVLLLGRGEDSLHRMDLEMAASFPALPRTCLLADVRDRSRLARLFEEHRPQVVFHAAAHKHVPMVEANPGEAITNNVEGTQNVAELALAHKVERFVLVSTDKAVNPTNVMGASKRCAELVVRSLQGQGATRFMVVRFGNVLGSRGSVVPLFQRQIAAGGPVTLTHPDIIRYFMTIPEASQLVVQAGALGQGGETFVLDMGEPVKILDLARDMIRLHGLEPEVDIPIVFTGLRPGEKLHEELLTAEEGTTATQFRKIFVAQAEVVPPERLRPALARLGQVARVGRPEEVRQALQDLVPGYRPEQGGPRAHPLALEAGAPSLTPVRGAGTTQTP